MKFLSRPTQSSEFDKGGLEVVSQASRYKFGFYRRVLFKVHLHSPDDNTPIHAARWIQSVAKSKKSKRGSYDTRNEKEEGKRKNNLQLNLRNESPAVSYGRIMVMVF